jgi:hypothetical protein
MVIRYLKHVLRGRGEKCGLGMWGVDGMDL